MTDAFLEKRCGTVALVGRPNVGKSTLLNHLVGQKVSITSRKPQTTRQRLQGIKTVGHAQIIFVDTPGYHLGFKKVLNRQMNKTITNTVADVSLILFMVDRLWFNEEDEHLLENIARTASPVFLVINKIDEFENKELLLPFIDLARTKYAFAEVVPLSALKQQNTSALESTIVRYLPVNDWIYPEDQLTDRNSRYLAAEFVREKITRQMGDELPYEVAVEIEEFKMTGGIYHISALILVERDGQKTMLIGESGSRLKLIGTEARKDMERLFDCKVMLKLWVKVKSGWSDDERALRSLGFDC
ncbi:MAG: GTPase Era [Pseudohongiellaceae bacterium]